MKDKTTGKKTMLSFASIAIIGFLCIILSFVSRLLFPDNGFTIQNPEKQLANLPVKKTFKVVVFSDIAQNLRTIEEELDAVNDTDADFAICNGDLVQSGASENEFAFVQKQLVQKIKKPLFLLPGNHDFNKQEGFELYRRFFGQERYWWSYSDTLFIAINTGNRRFNETEQIFLKETLENERHKYNRCILVMHCPPVDLRPGRKKHSIRNNEECAILSSLVSTYGVNMIVTSHLHWFLQGNFAGVPIFHTPSGGQRVRDPDNQHIGFVLMSFEADGQILLERVNVTAERGRNLMTFFLHIASCFSIYLVCSSLTFIVGLSGLAIQFFSHRKNRMRLQFPDMANTLLESPTIIRNSNQLTGD